MLFIVWIALTKQVESLIYSALY